MVNVTLAAQACYKLLQVDTRWQCFICLFRRNYDCQFGKHLTGTQIMKRSTKIITAVALTLGIAGGAAAIGKHQFGDPEKRAAKVAAYIAYELELDETQKQALDVLKTQMMAARQTVKADKSAMKQEALGLINADTFDRAKALDMINSKVLVVNEQAPDMINALGDFLDTLNAEQKAEIAEFVQERRGHHGRKHRD